MTLVSKLWKNNQDFNFNYFSTVSEVSSHQETQEQEGQKVGWRGGCDRFYWQSIPKSPCWNLGWSEVVLGFFSRYKK